MGHILPISLESRGTGVPPVGSDDLTWAWPRRPCHEDPLAPQWRRSPCWDKGFISFRCVR